MITAIIKKVLQKISKGKGSLRREIQSVSKFLNLVNFYTMNKMKKYTSNTLSMVVVAKLTQLG